MNRGSGDVVLMHDLAMLGFNEAPIHESGKSFSPRRPAPGNTCFNEAPIHESGKSWRRGH